MALEPVDYSLVRQYAGGNGDGKAAELSLKAIRRMYSFALYHREESHKFFDCIAHTWLKLGYIVSIADI